jgi:tRNA(Ile)-lysidine synthase
MSQASLTTHLRRALKKHLPSPNATILIAVSGGPDSMALLSAAAFSKTQVRWFAHGIDHGLRSAARDELALAATFARSVGIPFETTCLTLEASGNLMANARRARYGALAAAAASVGAWAVATGHHADDQAETVLLRLLRGAGPRGLSAMRMLSSIPTLKTGGLRLFRPLLEARRSDIELHLERHGVPYAEDPTNQNPRFLRTRVRRELLPMLTRLSPNIVMHLGELASNLSKASPFSPLVRLSPGSYPTFDYTVLSGLSRAQRTSIEALPQMGSEARVSLGGGLVVRYERAQVMYTVEKLRDRSRKKSI